MSVMHAGQLLLKQRKLQRCMCMCDGYIMVIHSKSHIAVMTNSQIQWLASTADQLRTSNNLLSVCAVIVSSMTPLVDKYCHLRQLVDDANWSMLVIHRLTTHVAAAHLRQLLKRTCNVIDKSVCYVLWSINVRLSLSSSLSNCEFCSYYSS